MSKQPSTPTIKKLFALSGNACAFPQCPTPMIDPESGTIIGEVCHIRAREEGGPRYDPTQDDGERNGFENLVLMCSVHHKVIDTDVQAYTVERLQEIKAAHEAKHKHGLPPSDEVAEKLLHTLDVAGSVISTVNQQGGQVAHQITNIYHQPPQPQVMLTTLIEWLLTKVDHEVGIDFYDFRVSLRNDGETTVRDFRVDVQLPNAYMNQYTIYAAEVTERRTAEWRLFRHTQKHFPGRVFYPGDTYLVMSADYQVTKEQYRAGITESITVTVYSDDRLVSKNVYPIANMLNPERVQHILGGQ
jgi:hypothetical protein